MGQLVAYLVLTQTGLGNDKERAWVEVQTWESRTDGVLQIHYRRGYQV